jgi:2-polyprenyl-3-methyl-5-hydroxy-6-metoxy-1,4-benzoquinol methylase
MKAFTDHRQARAELRALTRAQPEDAFFLEHSRALELAYIEHSHTRWLEILQLVRKRLPNSRELSCLDIGTSPFTFLLRSYFKSVSTLDLSGAFRARCAAAGIVLYQGGVTSEESVAQVNPVDCVFCLEVLEHLHANPVEVLGRLRSVLAKGGLLALTTPNLMCFANRIRMLLNGKLQGFTYPPFRVPDSAHGFGHDRIYMPAELREYMESAGFRNVDIRYQIHCGDSSRRRLVPRLIKRAVPSMRDGIAIFGFDS